MKSIIILGIIIGIFLISGCITKECEIAIIQLRDGQTLTLNGDEHIDIHHSFFGEIESLSINYENGTIIRYNYNSIQSISCIPRESGVGT